MVDALALAFSALLIAGYHLYLRTRARSDPLFAVHSVNRIARRRWVDAVMRSGSKDVLAVQTLRNSVMAASFMASTAILLIVGTLNLAVDVDKLDRTGQLLHFAGTPGAVPIGFKLALLVAAFFVAFFFHSMAVRFFNHVGYLINVPDDGGDTRFSPAAVAAYLNRAGHYYSLGTRTFYYCVPLVAWLFGPYAMAIGTVALTVALYRLDRAPKDE